MAHRIWVSDGDAKHREHRREHATRRRRAEIRDPDQFARGFAPRGTGPTAHRDAQLALVGALWKSPSPSALRVQVRARECPRRERDGELIENQTLNGQVSVVSQLTLPGRGAGPTTAEARCGGTEQARLRSLDKTAQRDVHQAANLADPHRLVTNQATQPPPDQSSPFSTIASP